MDTNEITRNANAYVGYEYKTISVDSEKASLCLDAYENFGWAPDDSLPERQFAGKATLKMKRDRKILNKAELTRLQQHFEACMDEIAVLESSKTKTAAMYSVVAGMIGTAFMAGSVFAVTNEQPMIILCVLLGIPGVIGWVLPYFIFKRFAWKRMIAVKPLIEQKFDEICEICKQGNALIH